VDLEARVTALETQLRELTEQRRTLHADIPNSTDLVDKDMRDLRESVNNGFSAVTNALQAIAAHQQRIAELITLLTGSQGAGAAF
jgi:molecular chaperone GrpE (heat shock protein)